MVMILHRSRSVLSGLAIRSAQRRKCRAVEVRAATMHEKKLDSIRIFIKLEAISNGLNKIKTKFLMIISAGGATTATPIAGGVGRKHQDGLSGYSVGWGNARTSCDLTNATKPRRRHIIHLLSVSEPSFS